MRELARLAAITDAANLACAKAVEKAQADCLAKLFVEVDDKPVAIADRVKFLATELEAFTRNNRAALLIDRKSIDLNAGRIGYREGKPTVEEIKAPEGEKKSPWDLVRERVREWLFKALEKCKLGAGSKAAGLFSISASLNKNAAVAAVKAKQITAAQLARLGYQYCPPQDSWFYELSTQQLDSQSESSPVPNP